MSGNKGDYQGKYIKGIDNKTVQRCNPGPLQSNIGSDWCTKKVQFISQANLVHHAVILFYKQRFTYKPSGI